MYIIWDLFTITRDSHISVIMMCVPCHVCDVLGIVSCLSCSTCDLHVIIRRLQCQSHSISGKIICLANKTRNRKVFLYYPIFALSYLWDTLKALRNIYLVPPVAHLSLTGVNYIIPVTLHIMMYLSVDTCDTCGIVKCLSCHSGDSWLSVDQVTS